MLEINKATTKSSNEQLHQEIQQPHINTARKQKDGDSIALACYGTTILGVLSKDEDLACDACFLQGHGNWNYAMLRARGCISLAENMVYHSNVCSTTMVYLQ